MAVKALGICGSPRKRNTYYMIETVLKATGLDYEIIKLCDLKIDFCNACVICEKRPYKCGKKDDMQKLHNKLLDSEIIVLGSPTYFDNVSGRMKNFIDRCLPFYWTRQLKGKKTAIVAVGSEDEKSIKENLRAIRRFCKHVNLKVLGSVLATQSNPKKKTKELIRLGNKLAK